MPSTVNYSQVLSTTVKYCQLLSSTVNYVKYCQLLSSTVNYSQVLSTTVKYCQLEYLVNLRTPSHGRDCTSQMQAPNYTNLFLHNARYLSLYTVKVLLLTEQQERHSEQEPTVFEINVYKTRNHHTDVDLKFRKTS